MIGLTKLAALGTVFLVLSMSFGASAFTTTAIDREVSITVQNDENGLLALADGTSGPLIHGSDTNELVIDLAAAAPGTGPNVNARFTFGLGHEFERPRGVFREEGWTTDTHAFSITNNDGEAHTVRMQYNVFEDDPNDVDNIRFVVYNREGQMEAIVSDERSRNWADLKFNVGQTKYVTLVITTPTGESAVGTTYDGRLRFHVGHPVKR